MLMFWCCIPENAAHGAGHMMHAQLVRLAHVQDPP